MAIITERIQQINLLIEFQELMNNHQMTGSK